jgi:hypothetical protein
MAARRNVIGVICNELYTSAATPRQGDDATVALGEVVSILLRCCCDTRHSRLNRGGTNETIATIRSIHISASHDKRDIFLRLISYCPRVL